MRQERVSTSSLAFPDPKNSPRELPYGVGSALPVLNCAVSLEGQGAGVAIKVTGAIC